MKPAQASSNTVMLSFNLLKTYTANKATNLKPRQAASKRHNAPILITNVTHFAVYNRGSHAHAHAPLSCSVLYIGCEGVFYDLFAGCHQGYGIVEVAGVPTVACNNVIGGRTACITTNGSDGKIR